MWWMMWPINTILRHFLSMRFIRCGFGRKFFPSKKKKNWTEYNLIYFLCICVITELWYVKMLMRCDSVVCCGQKATLLCMGPDFRDQMILFAIPAVKVCRIACSIILEPEPSRITHTNNKWFICDVTEIQFSKISWKIPGHNLCCREKSLMTV